MQIGIHFKDFSHSFNEVLATQAVKTLNLASPLGVTTYSTTLFAGYDPRFVVSYSSVFTKSFHFPLEFIIFYIIAGVVGGVILVMVLILLVVLIAYCKKKISKRRGGKMSE